MGLFTSLFGKSGSDKADKLRQQAIDAFNSIKTPELSSLQVQLDKYVQQGVITPEQAEATLLHSNAFNDIKTDPALEGAQKQALEQLQQIRTQGGLTAIDKAQLQDITDTNNQEANSRLAAIRSNARERGVGGSGLELSSELSNEQAAADRAARAGTDVAAQAQQRALDAIQGARTAAGNIRSQEFNEQEAKAEAQNAIDKFNATTSNNTNMYNTQTANAAKAANLGEQQRIADTNTQTGNVNKTYNANAVQQQYDDAMKKAQGLSGAYTSAANAAEENARADRAAELSLIGGGLKTAATVGGAAIGGPAGVAIGSNVTDIGNGNTTNSKYKMNPDGSYNFSSGGKVPDLTITPKDEEDFSKFMAEMKSPTKMNMGGETHTHSDSCYYEGGRCMNKGGFLKDLKKGALHKDLGVPSDKPIPSGKLEKATHSNNETLRKRAQFAENAKHWNHMAEGGQTDESTHLDSTKISEKDKKEHKEEPGLIERIGNLLGSHADVANNIDSKDSKKGSYDFKSGGKVPGHPIVPNDSPKNDTIPAMLSPGEIVVPRTMAKKVENGDDHMISSALHSLINHKKKEVK